MISNSSVLLMCVFISLFLRGEDICDDNHDDETDDDDDYKFLIFILLFLSAPSHSRMVVKSYTVALGLASLPFPFNMPHTLIGLNGIRVHFAINYIHDGW